MAVITISRELGADGTYIGKQVAKTLGYGYVDKLVMEQILSQYGLVNFDNLYHSAPGFWERFDEMNIRLIAMLNRTLLALARHNNLVLVGRGGFVVLKDYADVLHVLVQAPMPLRIQRIMDRKKISDPGQAEAMVHENDQVREAFLKSFYHASWDTASTFHLKLDTGLVTPDTAVSWIAAAARDLEQRKLDPAHTTQAIEVDPILADTVAEILASVQTLA